ncbi:MAG: GNAT family N-acetyltransferase [Thermoanaerobaculia bacterium]
MIPAEDAASTLTLREVLPEDRDFLRDLYASTRLEELAPVPWSEAQKRDFLRAQFEAQDHEYHRAYPDGVFRVIEIDGVSAGRLYLRHGTTDSRIIDLAFLPEFRGRGFGSRILAGLAREADAVGRTLSIHVEVFNTGARRLYERFGFGLDEDKGVYLLLARPPRG